MANFFKDYHKNRVTSLEQVKTKADTKKEALTGKGQIYSIHQIN